MTLQPRLLKGGLVQIDPDTAQVLRVIALQYNPDTLTRTLQLQARRQARRGDRSQALRLKGPPVETIKLDAEIDATDQLEHPDCEPGRRSRSGIAPAARGARDARLPARATSCMANNALAAAGDARDRCRSRRR